jgi:hypothetical protein
MQIFFISIRHAKEDAYEPYDKSSSSAKKPDGFLGGGAVEAPGVAVARRV